MSALDALQIEEYRDELLASCKKLPQAVTPAFRPGPEKYITFHYAGVPYGDRRESVERARVISEAREHMRRDWGDGIRQIYADRLMYDFVVLSSGTILRTGGGHELWHCRNVTGNRWSWSVHVLLGSPQDLTPVQRERLFALFDALRADGALARDRVVGHCEWPVTPRTGAPVPLPTYQPRPGQSACPGRVLHGHLAAYRSLR